MPVGRRRARHAQRVGRTLLADPFDSRGRFLAGDEPPGDVGRRLAALRQIGLGPPWQDCSGDVVDRADLLRLGHAALLTIGSSGAPGSATMCVATLSAAAANPALPMPYNRNTSLATCTGHCRQMSTVS